MSNEVLQNLMNDHGAISEMLQGYVECFLWCEGPRETEDDDQSFQYHNYDADDVSDDLALQIIADMDEFYAHICADLVLLKYLSDEFNDWPNVGHDFWLTRNGHGAGFWDGDHKEPHGDKLTGMAHLHGTMDLYSCAGEIFGM